jgi:hypothetical protein
MTFPILREMSNFEHTGEEINTEIAPNPQDAGADIAPNEVTVPDQDEQPQTQVPPEVE